MEKYDTSMAPRFTRLIDQRLAELGAVLRDDLVDVEAGSHEVRDFKDVAGEQSLAAVDDAQSTSAVQEIRRLVAAQRRIADRTYGSCVLCGDAIDLRRLAALPDTPYCAACQTGREHGRFPSAQH